MDKIKTNTKILVVQGGGIVPPPVNQDKALQDGIEGIANVCKGLLNIKSKNNEKSHLATEDGSSWKLVDYTKGIETVRKRNAENEIMNVEKFFEEGGKITKEGFAINKNGLPFQGVLTSKGEITDIEHERAVKSIEYDIYGRPTTILYHIPCQRNDVVTSITYDENNIPTKTVLSETITPLGKGYETSPIFYRD